jgi:hypothetical protein
MAGFITQQLRGFGGSLNIQPRSQLTLTSTRDRNTSTTIGYNPPVTQMEGRQRVRDHLQLQMSKNMPTKPNRFFSQQDKIINFIPPIENHVYTLDTQNMTIPKASENIQSKNNTPNITSNRNPNLVEVGRPIEYSTVKTVHKSGYTQQIPTSTHNRLVARNPKHDTFSSRFQPYPTTRPSIDTRRDVKLNANIPSFKTIPVGKPRSIVHVENNPKIPTFTPRVTKRFV